MDNHIVSSSPAPIGRITFRLHSASSSRGLGRAIGVAGFQNARGQPSKTKPMGRKSMEHLKS